MSDQRCQYLSVDDFKQKISKGEDIDQDTTILRKLGGGKKRIKRINEETRQVDFVISTASVDRDGDTVDVSGWDLQDYEDNPVVLWAHDHRGLPIGKSVELRQTKNTLESTAEFTSRDENPMGDTVFRMYAKGFLSATSVGFKPKRWEFVEEDDSGNRGPWAMDFKEQTLLEFSAVPVPSNPEALIQARAKGIDTEPLVEWIEQTLDEMGEDGDEVKLWIPRSKLEKMWENARTKKGTILILDSLTQKRLREENLRKAEEFNASKEEDKATNTEDKSMETIEFKFEAEDVLVRDLTFAKNKWLDVDKVKEFLQANGVEFNEDKILDGDDTIVVPQNEGKFDESAMQTLKVQTESGEVLLTGGKLEVKDEDVPEVKDEDVPEVKDEDAPEAKDEDPSEDKDEDSSEDKDEDSSEDKDEDSSEEKLFTDVLKRVEEVLQKNVDLLEILSTKEITLIESKSEDEDPKVSGTDTEQGKESGEEEFDISDISAKDLEEIVDSVLRKSLN